MIPGRAALARRVVNRVLIALDGRKGFDDWWGLIDDEIRDEIEAELVAEVEKELAERWR
jgi:hypothetical protein